MKTSAVSSIGEMAKKHARDEDEIRPREASDSEEANTSGVSEQEFENDEQDLENVSSDNDDVQEQDLSESEAEDDETDDEFPMKKKSKMSKHDDGSKEFSSAVNAILSSHLKAYDRKDPIMARNKKVLKKNEADKLESQARKAIANEKRKLLNKARKKEIIPVLSKDSEVTSTEIRQILEKESKLRKVAQKGVVKLFNAILSTQVKTDKEVSENLSNVKNQKERKELITEVSKEKFLDLVKAAAQD